MAARILAATSGISRAVWRKAWAVMTITVTGVLATTLALRRVSATRPISPKKSPGPSSASSWSPRRTSTVPCSIAKNS